MKQEKKSFEHARERSKHGDGGIHYKHDLGQHFLYDEELLTHLTECCDLCPEEGVLEIGPGAGTLTRCLCRAAGKVVAVEADHDVIPFLKAATLEFNNLTILEGDIRRVQPSVITGLLGSPLAVISNIPYNITSPIFDLLLSNQLPADKIGVMVQKEVAHKLFAEPSAEAYGLLSLRVQHDWDFLFSEDVPAERFTPPPKVDSTFICMVKKQNPARAQDEALMWRMIRAAFSLRRKTLVNALKGIPQAVFLKEAMRQTGISETARGEELSLSDWMRLSDTVSRLSR